jgi:hypothetical protein
VDSSRHVAKPGSLHINSATLKGKKGNKADYIAKMRVLKKPARPDTGCGL